MLGLNKMEYPKSAMQWVTYLKTQLSQKHNYQTARALFQLIFMGAFDGKDIASKMILNSSTEFLKTTKIKYGFKKTSTANKEERIEIFESIALIAHLGFLLEDLMSQQDLNENKSWLQTFTNVDSWLLEPIENNVCWTLAQYVHSARFSRKQMHKFMVLWSFWLFNNWAIMPETLPFDLLHLPCALSTFMTRLTT